MIRFIFSQNVFHKDHINPYNTVTSVHPLSVLGFQSNEIIGIFPMSPLSLKENAYTHYMDSF